jgi:ankyrin repeat protein
MTFHHAIECAGYIDDSLTSANKYIDYNVKLALQLIDRGAKIDERNKKGYTPLSMACARGLGVVVKKLIEHKASINTNDAHDFCFTYDEL